MEPNTPVPEHRLDNGLLTPLSSSIVADALSTLRPEMQQEFARRLSQNRQAAEENHIRRQHEMEANNQATPRPRKRRQVRREPDMEPAEPALIQSLLAEEFSTFEKETADFPPTITTDIKRSCLEAFHTRVEMEAKRSPCEICGMLYPTHKLDTLSVEDPRLRGSSHLFSCCGSNPGHTISLCTTCAGDVVKGRVPKYSSGNCVNITRCDKYPEELKDLTFVEEALIARSHPIGCVMKLSKGVWKGIEYNGIRGHFCTFRQDHNQLLHILPSRELALHEVVTVSWEVGREPSPQNLARFCRVRKAKVLAALQCLCANNPLYRHHVQIDHALLNEWDDDFVPVTLKEHAIVTEPDVENSRVGYAADLGGGSFSNDLDAALGEAEPGSILGSTFYSDQDRETCDPSNAFFAKIMEVVETSQQGVTGNNDMDNRPPAHMPQIRFRSTTGLRPMNSYQDKDFFTAAYPTLFPLGIGGHIEDEAVRSESLSLQSFAQWALSHHSHR
jgi:hypothetical protein